MKKKTETTEWQLSEVGHSDLKIRHKPILGIAILLAVLTAGYVFHNDPLGLKKGTHFRDVSVPSINPDSAIAGAIGEETVPESSASELINFTYAIDPEEAIVLMDKSSETIRHRSEPIFGTYRKVMCDFLSVYSGEQDTFENWRDYSTSAVWLEAYSLVDRDIAYDLVEFRDEAIAYSIDVTTWGDVTSPPHQLFYASYARALISAWNARDDLGLIDEAEIMEISEERLASQYGDKVYRILDAMGRRPVVRQLYFTSPDLLPLVERVSTEHQEEAYNFSLKPGEPLKC